MVHIKDLETIYKCDECGHIFKGKEAKLKLVPNDVHFSPSLFMNFIFVDKEGKVRGGYNPPKEDDSILHCPKCEEPHLFGFTKLEKKKK